MGALVIGIDTSGGVCSVAAVSGSKLIGEFSVNNKKTHSAMLVPMLDELFKIAEISMEDVDLFAVANGPGSFTGLRIGAATAKGFSFATKKPIVGVPTLLALSYNIKDTNDLVCPIMDARRNEVYTAVYDYSRGETETIDSPVIAPTACPVSELLDRLRELGRRVIFLGDGVPVYEDYISENACFSYSHAPQNQMLQRASSVAFLGEILAGRGLAGPSESLKLGYLRKPQAEREREERLGRSEE